jgi:hypothetical protein
LNDFSNEEVVGRQELDGATGKRVEQGHGQCVVNESEPPV